jgi:hypothetical protein
MRREKWRRSITSLAVLVCVVIALPQGTDAQRRRTKQRKPKDRIVGCGGPVCTSVTAPTNEVGPGERLPLQVNAGDPDGDVLTFTWTATGGTIEGRGANVEYVAPSDSDGEYIVTVQADDGYGHTVDCSIAIQVRPKPGLQ